MRGARGAPVPLGLAFLAYLAAAAGTALPDPRTGTANGSAQPSASATPSGEARATPEAVLEGINRIRSDRGLRPLRAEPVLAAIAAERAAASQAGPLDPQDATRRDRDAAARSGFEAGTFTEIYVGSEGGVETVLSNARASSDFAEELGRDEIAALGIGVARRDGMPIYVFLFASSQADLFASKTEGLGDLASVRREILSRVNRERTAAGRTSLRAQPRLDEAALRHAQDMLARSYYGHRSPEGRTPFDRGRAAGYRSRAVGENIARGPHSAAEVMDAWMRSPEHRAHILSRDFTETGSAVAVGRNASGYQVIWVQCFGRPEESN